MLLCVFFWTVLWGFYVVVIVVFLKCGPVFQESPRVLSSVLIIITSELVPKAIQLGKKYLHKESDIFSDISIYRKEVLSKERAGWNSDCLFRSPNCKACSLIKNKVFCMLLLGRKVCDLMGSPESPPQRSCQLLTAPYLALALVTSSVCWPSSLSHRLVRMYLPKQTVSFSILFSLRSPKLL